jgi:RimJ/RimL family protein N-acetyltransferase
MQLFRSLCKQLAKSVIADYSIYYIFAVDVAEVAPANSPFEFGEVDRVQLQEADEEVKVSRGYAGDEAIGFSLFENAKPVCAAWFWYGARYRERNFWPLAEREAKLVHIITSPSMQGKGLAPLLLDHCVKAMHERGFQKLYARIWFSNTPSVRAFRKAGWQRIALVITVKFRGAENELRLNIGSQPNAPTELATQFADSLPSDQTNS